MKARRASHTIRGCFGGSSMFSDRKLYCHHPQVISYGLSDLIVELRLQTHRCEPGVMPNKCGSSRREGAPPQTAYAVLLDTPAEQGSASRTLGLHRGLEGVDRGQYHAECGSTVGGNESVCDSSLNGHA